MGETDLGQQDEVGLQAQKDELTAIVTNVQRFSIHDGGGIRTAAFLKGCPFRCPWCCNPENLSFQPQEVWHSNLCIRCSMPKGKFSAHDCPRTAAECPSGAKELVGRTTTVGQLVDECLRDRVFFEESGGGVTLSGGECMSRQDFSLAFLQECHRRGVQTAIESTLGVPLQDPEALARACDVFLVDFKIADRQTSLDVAGLDPDVRDANVRALMDAMGADGTAGVGRIVGRMPIIPGYTDSRENVQANVERMVRLGIGRADVLPFHQLGQGKYQSAGMDYALDGVAQLTEGDVRWVADVCEAAGISTTVSGE